MQKYWTRIQNGVVSTDVRRQTFEADCCQLRPRRALLSVYVYLGLRAEAKREEAVSV
jgi:hypothetical protein